MPPASSAYNEVQYWHCVMQYGTQNCKIRKHRILIRSLQTSKPTDMWKQNVNNLAYKGQTQESDI